MAVGFVEHTRFPAFNYWTVTEVKAPGYRRNLAG